RPNTAPSNGGVRTRLQLLPPLSEVAIRARGWGCQGVRSPPATIPSEAFRNAMVNPPADGLDTSGVSYACQVCPPSVVASTRATLEPPAVIQARWSPWVAIQVPLAAKPNSPGRAR